MAVITISRGSFSGGKTMAECLARRLGYRCVDRDVIVERASAAGVSQDELRDAIDKPPSFLDRFRHKKYLYLTLFQAALVEEVREGKAVYHGNAGHLLLRGAGPVLRTRIIAPLEFRIKMCMDRLKLSRAEAISYIERMDAARMKWAQYLYGVNWTDASLYDVVINLEFLTIERACAMIGHIVREQGCFEFGPACRKMMDEFALACRVKAALALDPSTAHLEMESSCVDGVVRLKGRLPSLDLVEDIHRVAGAVPGVKELNLEDLISSTHS